MRQLQRRRQPVEHQAEHVLPQRDRGAEIAVRDAGQPDEELLDDRLVEAVERAQPVDVGLAGAGRQHHGDRVAGRDADHHEHDDRHAEQRDGHGQEADEEPLQDHLRLACSSRTPKEWRAARLPV